MSACQKRTDAKVFNTTKPLTSHLPLTTRPATFLLWNDGAMRGPPTTSPLLLVRESLTATEAAAAAPATRKPPPRRCRMGMVSIALAALAFAAVSVSVGVDVGLYLSLLLRNPSRGGGAKDSTIGNRTKEDEAFHAHIHPLSGKVLLYMVSTHDEFQLARIEEMRSVFREDLYVVWDSKSEPDCPYRHLVTCLQNDNGTFNVSATRQFTNRGFGQEVAVLWSIAHRHSYRHFWFMEEDVHYTDISQLVQVVTMPSSADLLSHGPLYLMTDGWFHAYKVRQQSGNVFGNTSHYWKMLNLFRMSSALLDGLERIYERNARNWIFFESLIPTTVAHFNLTHEDWTKLRHENGATYQFRYRPCYLNFSTPGIYHPAKVRNGTFQPCDFTKVG
jgi:hypothetical protein